MRTVLITTEDDLLASIFWESFRVERGKKMAKIILLPSRTDVDWSVVLKPVVAWKLLRLSGIIRLIRLKAFGTRVAIESMCEELVNLASLDSESLSREVAKSEVDVLISVGAPIVFKADLLAIPRLCSLNLHNGDITKYRGHFSTFWEVINKEDKFFLTLHEMTSKVDSGVIYDQKFTSKEEMPTFLDIMIWKKATGGQMLAANLNLLDNMECLGEYTESDAGSIRATYYSFPTIYDVFRFRF